MTQTVDSQHSRMTREFFFLPLWKYTAISAVIASVPFLLLQHVIVEGVSWVATAAASWFGYELASSVAFTTSVLIGSFLFSAVMPFIGHFFLPILALVQVFVLTRYLQAYATEFLPGQVRLRPSLARDLWIVAKWTIIKWILFVILHPIQHIPLFGLAMSVTISTIWIMMIYVEIALQASCSRYGRRSFIKSQGAKLFWFAILGMAISYILLAIVGIVSVTLPGVRAPLTVLVSAIVMAGGLMSASELLELVVAHERGQR